MQLSTRFFTAISAAMLFSICVFAQTTAKGPNATRATSIPASRNTWRGITPLRSSASDIARIIGAPADSPEASLVGPFRLDDGEVSFTYLTPSLAKMYRAPASLTNKIFTIYIKPSAPVYRTDLQLDRSFKKCAEEGIRGRYYLVSDTGVAYQIVESTEKVETIIYQPSRLEVRRLAVNTECVF